MSWLFDWSRRVRTSLVGDLCCGHQATVDGRQNLNLTGWMDRTIKALGMRTSPTTYGYLWRLDRFTCVAWPLRYRPPSVTQVHDLYAFDAQLCVCGTVRRHQPVARLFCVQRVCSSFCSFRSLNLLFVVSPTTLSICRKHRGFAVISVVPETEGST